MFFLPDDPAPKGNPEPSPQGSADSSAPVEKPAPAPQPAPSQPAASAKKPGSEEVATGTTATGDKVEIRLGKPPQPPANAGGAETPSGPDDKKKRPPRVGLFFTFLGLFLFLFVLFIAFLVVMLLQNGGNNPILGALGVEPALLQQLLGTLVSLVFGFLSLIGFILTVVGVFRRLTSTKAEVEKKKQSLILAGVSGLFLVFCVVVWLLLYFYISRLQIGSGGAAVILSEPADTINLTAPIDVTFTARELEQLYVREGIVSYAWDLDSDGEFDDGNGRDIQYSYTSRGNADGTYNVAVRIVLVSGQEVVVQKLLTIANVLPEVVVDYTPKVLEVPVEITFDASGSRDPDGNIISYDWDFDGDGATDAQGAQVSFEFTEAVQQEVIIRLTDNNGESREESLLMDFRQGRRKQAVITARPGLRGEVPFSVNLDGSNSFIGERILGYEWDFGDNSPIFRGRVSQHDYAEAGEYTVLLTVEGESGQRYEVEETVIVERSQNTPTAIIQVENLTVRQGAVSGQAPLEVIFNGEESRDRDGAIVEYRWDFDGDETTDGIGEEVAHTFVEGGRQTVTLTVIDDDDLVGTAEIVVEVEVPEVQVEVDVNTFSGPIPLEVSFDASASRVEEGKIISYTWRFGDGGPEVIGSAKQNHLYSNVGEYTVEVEVLTDTGKRGTKEFLIVAREVELLAEFTVNPPEPVIGKKVFFDASDSQGQISGYYWEFGDGAISRVVKPDHIYTQPGTYTVKLEVYDRKNRVSRKEVEVEIGQVE